MNNLIIKDELKRFLSEDIGTGDLSTDLVFGSNTQGSGYFTAKQDGIVCGVDIIAAAYDVYGGAVDVTLYKRDGDIVKKGEKIAYVCGSVSTMLSCERVILNLMQLMSGIAAYANALVMALDDYTIRVCDTRKTHPGLRMFEKYAVCCGGGYNHRFALYDGVMLKDNHIAFAGGIKNAVAMVKSKLGHMVKIEVETETADQVRQAVEAGADVIMFDNRTPQQIRDLQKLVPKHIITEASGGITLDTIGSYRGCGVNYISTGSVTNSAKPLDISFTAANAIKV